MPNTRRIIFTLACCIATPDIAHAQRFNAPPGTIGDVVAALGARARATIVIRDPALAQRRSPGARGNLTFREALRQALRGTDGHAVFHDSLTVEIVRKKAPAPVRTKPASQPVAAMDREEPGSDIVVTASKQTIALSRYPGSVKVVDPGEPWFAANAAEGSAAFAKLLPALGSTNLGPGRNKLFVRGIADSSFSGPTQATTGQYLGDARLTYNAPDPNLNLYDMKRVEVLVGPQGALYGAGSLGGVIRLVPHMPDTENAMASATATVGSTRHGGLNVDGAAMVNAPLIPGKLAARLVVFGSHAGGYIDAPTQGRRDINSTDSFGQRFHLRAKDVGDWTIDLGVVIQNIASADGQYTLRGDPPLVRDTPIAEPFRNNYRLGYVALERKLGAADLVSTTSIAHHTLRSTFDATGFDGSSVSTGYTEDSDIWLAVHETRLAGGGARAPWVAGVGILFNRNRLSLSLDQRDNDLRQGGVINNHAELAVFSQITRPLSSTLSGTIGGRLTLAGSGRRLLGALVESPRDPTRASVKFAGVFALDWQSGGPLSAFYRYQQGYRAGGLGLTLSGSALQVRNFDPDDLHMHEVGIRHGDRSRDRLSFQAAIFHADWRNIQADLVGDLGLPFTANIGRGTIRGLDADLWWRPSPSLMFSVSAFLNDSELKASGAATPPATGAGVAGHRPTLPNIARSGARAAASWQGEIAAAMRVSGEVALRYVGRSSLGPDALAAISQGDYVIGDISARLDFEPFSISMMVENLGDIRANSFAYGNPFLLVQGRQVTPVQPRTVKLGIGFRF